MRWEWKRFDGLNSYPHSPTTCFLWTLLPDELQLAWRKQVEGGAAVGRERVWKRDRCSASVRPDLYSAFRHTPVILCSLVYTSIGYKAEQKTAIITSVDCLYPLYVFFVLLLERIQAFRLCWSVCRRLVCLSLTVIHFILQLCLEWHTWVSSVNPDERVASPLSPAQSAWLTRDVRSLCAGRTRFAPVIAITMINRELLQKTAG